MTKNTFIRKLRDNLSVLEKSEVDEIIAEYSDHIDQKINDGKSEAEAIADFGDIDELTKDILSAYHIEKNTKTLEDYVNIVLKFINETTEKVMRFDSQQLISFIVQFILMVIFINILKWPLDIVVGAIGRILPRFLWVILRFAYEIICFVVSICAIYLFLKKRLFNLPEESVTKEPVSQETETEVKGVKDKKVSSSKEYVSDETIANKKTIKEKPLAKDNVSSALVNNEVKKEDSIVSEKKTEKIVSSSKKSQGIDDVFMTLVKLLLALFIWLPAFATMCGCVIAIGIIFFLGYSFTWLMLILSGVVCVCLGIVLSLFRLIWGRAA